MYKFSLFGFERRVEYFYVRVSSDIRLPLCAQSASELVINNMKNTNQFKVLSLLSASLLLVPVASTLALVDVNVGASSSTTVESEAGTYSNTNSEAETQSESNTSLKVNASGVTVVSSTQVNSDADLEIFSLNITTKSNGMAKVKISSEDEQESRIVVLYKHRGKLFGFIPVAIRSTTEVMAKGNEDNIEVDSRLSWWGFLVAGENYDEAELESQIKSNAVIIANVKADASASAKARAAEAVIAEVQTHASTQMAVNNS